MWGPATETHLYLRLSKAEARRNRRARRELADRFGSLRREGPRLLDKSSLAIAGQEAGVSRIMLQSNRARVNFRAGIVPRMSALEGALKGEAVNVEVRRVSPLSVVVECSDPGRLASVIARAVDALGGAEVPANQRSMTDTDVVAAPKKRASGMDRLMDRFAATR